MHSLCLMFFATMSTREAARYVPFLFLRPVTTAHHSLVRGFAC